MNSGPETNRAQCLPDFAGGSLVNLMQTLQDGLSARPAAATYAPLAAHHGLSAEHIADAAHVLLLVVDGLGARQLERHAPDGWFAAHRASTLTSVFPSTTAAAIPLFLSGLSPRAHGLLGWHLRDESSGEIVATLPLKPRRPNAARPAGRALAERLIGYQPLAARLAGSRCWVSPAEIADSPFNRAHTRGGPVFGYRDITEFGNALSNACAYHRTAGGDRPRVPGFTYAYMPWPDTLMHELGCDDPRVGETIRRIEKVVAALHQSQPGLCLIVTADHGFLDAPAERLIEIEANGPNARWLDYLEAPLWGERRVAFAALRPGCREEFLDFVMAHHGQSLEAIDAETFLHSDWLGGGPAHPELAARVGDVVLITRDNWTIKDWLPGERRYEQRGVHGGGHPDEMLVPLISAP